MSLPLSADLPVQILVFVKPVQARTPYLFPVALSPSFFVLGRFLLVALRPLPSPGNVRFRVGMIPIVSLDSTALLTITVANKSCSNMPMLTGLACEILLEPLR